MRPRPHTGRAEPGHADDWLMTYADMITLLLCFFAVFLAISIQKKEVSHKAEVAQVVPLPARPVEVAPRREPPPRIERASPPAQAPAATPVAAKIEPPPAPPVAIPPADVIPPPELAELSSPVVAAPQPSPPPVVVAKPEPPAPAAPAPQGDRITTLEMNSAAFFDSGSATLCKAGEAILRDVAVQLKSEKLRDYAITVEGHTDDTPINTARFPSNWELSTARASAVARFLLEQGIAPQKLRAAGYADTFPKAPNRDANGNPIPENQSLNRRVVITLEKIERAPQR